MECTSPYFESLIYIWIYLWKIVIVCDCGDVVIAWFMTGQSSELGKVFLSILVMMHNKIK